MINKNSREKILQAVRQSLGKTAPIEPIDQQAHPTALCSPVIDFSACHKNTDGIENTVAQFIHSAIANQCTAVQINTESEIPNAVSEYLITQQRPRKIWGWQQFKHLNWTPADIKFCADVMDKKTPVDGTVGLTGVSYAIADTGSLVIQSHPQTPLQTDLLPESHIAIISQQQIHPTLPDVLNNQLLNKKENAQTVFISGPSRTADIEQTLVLGAHGPKYVHLIIVSD